MEIISDTGITVEENNENRIVVNDDAETWKVVSLFAGCGGLDLGFRGDFTFLNKHYPRNRFEIIWANEINKAACATYRENVDPRIIEGPIEEKFSCLPETADIVIGGFPCQDISINGKMAGVDGERSGLYVWMVRAVEKLRPKVFDCRKCKSLADEEARIFFRTCYYRFFRAWVQHILSSLQCCGLWCTSNSGKSHYRRSSQGYQK